MATATHQHRSTNRRPTRSRGARRGVELSPQRLFDAAGPVPKGIDREERLEEVVLTTWSALASGHPVECPVCSGPLTAEDGCSRCGSRLT
jgi:hypothetical protein